MHLFNGIIPNNIIKLVIPGSILELPHRILNSACWNKRILKRIALDIILN